MLKPARLNFELLFSVGASLFGLLTISMLALYPPTNPPVFSLRKPIVGLVFGIICVSGILAAVYPTKCLGAFEHQKISGPAMSTNSDRSAQLGNAVKGHHFDCERYSAHTIKIKEQTLCAACTGLSLGAMLALVGGIPYFLVGWQIQQSSLIVASGQLGVLLGFIQFKFAGLMRLALNAVFVLGAYFMLIGIDMLARNVFIDFYLILLIMLWIWTRILLSRWDHVNTCRTCKLQCKLKER
jgi:hypothetical protein